MFRDVCSNICRNKNILMLFSAGFYILGIFGAVRGYPVLYAGILTAVLILLLYKNLFPFKYLFLWILIFYIGAVNTYFRIKDTDELLSVAPVNSVIYGKISSIPQYKNDNKLRFFFKVDKISYDSIIKEFDDEKVLVDLNTDKKLKIHDSYEIQGRLSAPFKAGNPSQFDYGDYLQNFGAYAVFYGKDITQIDGRLSKSEMVLQKINDYREKIIGIHSKYLKSPNLEILGGIVFGDDAVSPPEYIKQSFINSGLLHILAASGMNVAFIFSFFFFFLSLLKVNYKINIVFCIIMVILYSLMTGLGASVVRAAFMLIFVLAGKLMDRDAHSISLLAFVALLMLLYNPMYINDVGFQLSFIVTFGLLLTMPVFIKSENKIINKLAGIVSVPIVAQLWVIPVQIFYFGNISIYSVFANIMSVLILSVISFGGFVSSIISPITPHFVCQGFDFVLNPLIGLLVKISEFWGNLPHASLSTTHPSVFQLILYYTILLNITALFNKDMREKYSKFLKIIIPSLIAVFLLSLISMPNRNLEITAFDVGNADSFLIKTPKNKYYMIDTGKSGYNGGKSQAEIIMINYLKDIGIRELEAVITTHFDSDHCGGAADIMKELKVKDLYVNSTTHPSLEAQHIYKTAHENGVNVIPAENKQIVVDGGGLIMTNFISENTRNNDDNDASILTLLKYNNFTMLFTGDSGIETFEEPKQYLPRNITVLKVGHHGALGVINKDMAEYLKPEISLISTGENKFGHPNIYTLSVLKNTKILRTDINNSIRFKVNKSGYKVYTFNKKRKKYIKLPEKSFPRSISE